MNKKINQVEATRVCGAKLQILSHITSNKETIQDNLIFLNHHSLSEGKYLIFYIFDGSFLDNIILKYKYIYNSFFFIHYQNHHFTWIKSS